jgi:hypothetical protein
VAFDESSIIVRLWIHWAIGCSRSSKVDIGFVVGPCRLRSDSLQAVCTLSVSSNSFPCVRTSIQEGSDFVCNLRPVHTATSPLSWQGHQLNLKKCCHQLQSITLSLNSFYCWWLHVYLSRLPHWNESYILLLKYLKCNVRYMGLHNIIQLHYNVMWEWQLSTEYILKQIV